MSFAVNLWSFSKPVNSTAIPSGTPKSFSCTANDNLSVMAPIIKIAEPLTTDMTVYNYAQISNFHRYYWITDMVYDRGLWFISLRVDPLASWKTGIGNISAYILRSAHTYDGNVLDLYYPAKNKFSINRVSVATPWQYGSLTDGCYSVGIVSSGSVTDFWLMSRSQLANLLGYMLSNQFAEDMIGELQLAANIEAKALADPLQYIASVTWLPIPLPATELTTIHVGYSDIPVNCAYATPSNPQNIILTFNRPTHPQAAARGAYMNGSPYSTYSLYIPPFGKIDLDGSIIMDANSIDARIRIDLCQGNGTLEVVVGTNVITRVNAKIGMPVQLSQVIAQGTGLTTAISNGLGAIGSFLSLSVGGFESKMASAIGDGIAAQIPSVNTVGSIGSCDSLVGTPALQQLCAEVVDDDLTSRGRPLCQVRQISTIPGFMVCADVEVNIGCTAAEHDMIKAFMERGFFYA